MLASHVGPPSSINLNPFEAFKYKNLHLRPKEHDQDFNLAAYILPVKYLNDSATTLIARNVMHFGEASKEKDFPTASNASRSW